MEHQKFCLFNLFSFKLQNLGELMGNVAQTTLKRKELRRIRDGLAKPKFQPILSGIICLVLLHDVLFDVLCNMLVGDLEYVFIMLERSPPTLIVVPTFYLTKKNKKKQTRTLPVETLGSLNFIIIIINFIFLLFIIRFFFFILCVHPTFLSFSINKTKVSLQK